MPLTPGPFVQVSPLNVTLPPGVYDFTDDALTLSAQISSNLSGWDAFVGAVSALAADPLADLLDPLYDGIGAAVAGGIGATALPSIDAALTSYGMADAQLSIAVSFAPPQAWVDPPAPFIPPTGALEISPIEIPAGAFTPADYLPPGSGVPGGPGVQLLNITRPGQSNFNVGDQFQVVGTGGKPGQVVTVDGSINGDDLGLSTIGTLDATGAFTVGGTMAPANVGAWQEYWYFDGVLSANINFIVIQANY